MRAVFRQALVILLIAAIPAIASAFLHREIFAAPVLAKDETTWRQIEEWQRAAPAVGLHILLVDARPSDAYQAKHVPGALSLNEAHWEQQLPALIEALRSETRVVIYCDDTLCNSSRAVAERLRRELALTDVFIVKDGWHGWSQRNASGTGTEGAR